MNDQRKRDWVDYGNLLVQLDQSLTLHGMDARLSQMQRADWEMRRRAEIEVQARQLIFRLHVHLDTMAAGKEEMEQDPISWLELISDLHPYRNKLKEEVAPVLTELSDLDCLRAGLRKLEQITDECLRCVKARVQTSSKEAIASRIQIGLLQKKLLDSELSEKLDSLIEECSRQLSPVEKLDLEKYLRYDSEAQELDNLIARVQNEQREIDDQIAKAKRLKEAAVAKLESLRPKVGTPEEKKERLRDVRRSALAKVGMIILGVPAGVAWCSAIFFLGVAICIFFTDEKGSRDAGLMFLIGIGAFFIALRLTVGYFELREKSKLKKSIEEEIADLGKEINENETYAEKVKRIQLSWPSSALTKFEAKDLPELLRRNEERKTFMLQFSQSYNFTLNDSTKQEQ